MECPLLSRWYRGDNTNTLYKLSKVSDYGDDDDDEEEDYDVDYDLPLREKRDGSEN